MTEHREPAEDPEAREDVEQAEELTDGGIGSVEHAPQTSMPQTDGAREAVDERPDA